MATRKAQRDRFRLEVVELLVSNGAVATGGSEYRMNTKAGPLSITVSDHGDSDSPTTIFTRFDFALAGESLVGASVPSGKYNFHFVAGTTCEAALDEIRRYCERIESTSLETFMDETAVVPQAVVRIVLEERGITDLRGTVGRLRMVDPPWAFNRPDNKDFQGAVKWFTRHCEERLVQLWDTNRRIAVKLKSESGLDIAYAFINHWLDAYLDCPPKYRDKHPNWEAPHNCEPMVA